MFDNPLTRIAVGIVIGGVLFALIMILLPIYPMPTEIQNAFSWLFNTIWQLNFVLPIATIMQIIGIYFLLDFIEISIKIVLFIKKHLTKSAS